MFTGIIRASVSVRTVSRRAGGLRLAVRKPAGWKIRPGESVAVDGVCSTLVRGGRDMHFEYMPETLGRTTLGALRAGEQVNLELSLRAADSISGHFVTGHVDAVGRISAVRTEGISRVYTLTFPAAYAALVAEKGSITVDGVSLTVVRAGRTHCTVKLVPYTLKHTGLGGKGAGSRVNLEFDLLAKYATNARAYIKNNRTL